VRIKRTTSKPPRGRRSASFDSTTARHNSPPLASSLPSSLFDAAPRPYFAQGRSESLGSSEYTSIRGLSLDSPARVSVTHSHASANGFPPADLFGSFTDSAYTPRPPKPSQTLLNAFQHLHIQDRVARAKALAVMCVPCVGESAPSCVESCANLTRRVT
jgi:hypothetical protein